MCLGSQGFQCPSQKGSFHPCSVSPIWARPWHRNIILYLKVAKVLFLSNLMHNEPSKSEASINVLLQSNCERIWNEKDNYTSHQQFKFSSKSYCECESGRGNKRKRRKVIRMLFCHPSSTVKSFTFNFRDKAGTLKNWFPSSAEHMGVWNMIVTVIYICLISTLKTFTLRLHSVTVTGILPCLFTQDNFWHPSNVWETCCWPPILSFQ